MGRLVDTGQRLTDFVGLSDRRMGVSSPVTDEPPLNTYFVRSACCGADETQLGGSGAFRFLSWGGSEGEHHQHVSLIDMAP